MPKQPVAAVTEVTIDNCDKEPIHIPNKVQPFGFLLAVSTGDLKILQCSDNIAGYIGIDYTELLEKPLSILFSKEIINTVTQAIFDGDVLGINPLAVTIRSKSFNAIFSFSSDILVIEFEPDLVSAESSNVFNNLLNKTVFNLQQSNTFQLMVDKAAVAIKNLTGYDRVMIYKFDEMYNGNVIAEAKEAHLNSFFSQKFPASDIPPQARELYLKNWIRIITDVNYKSSQILPAVNPQSGAFLDLSYSFLRSISPIHIEYLQNMGVRATLTISIVVKNKLWGLIACHHYSGEKFLDYNTRQHVEFLGKIISYQWEVIRSQDLQSRKYELSVIKDELLSKLYAADNYLAILKQQLPDVLKIADSEGVALFVEGKYLSLGLLPPVAFINSLKTWLLKQPGEIFYTEKLSEFYPAATNNADSTSGILSIKLADSSKSMIIWFKPEIAKSISWGGNPNEKHLVQNDENSYRLSPRKSFAKYEEIVSNQSSKWEEAEIHIAEAFKIKLNELIASKTKALKKQQLALKKKVKAKTSEIADLYQNLLEQNERLKKIYYQQSHGVRRPLANILGTIDLIETDAKNFTEAELIETMKLLKISSLQLDDIIRKISDEDGKSV